MDADPALPALRARWLHLTRSALPAQAAREGWPLRLDHCVMRVCLDNAVGGRWDRQVRPPAFRNLDRAALGRAVALAEAIAADPSRLGPLNARSLAWRRATLDGDSPGLR